MDMLQNVAICIAAISISLNLFVILLMRNSSLKKIQEFSKKQRASYDDLRERQKNNAAAEAMAYGRLQADLETLNDYVMSLRKSMIELRLCLDALDTALGSVGLPLLQEKWRKETINKRNKPMDKL